MVKIKYLTAKSKKKHLRQFIKDYKGKRDLLILYHAKWMKFPKIGMLIPTIYCPLIFMGL